MLNRSAEVNHLQLADQHIADANRLIRRLESLILNQRVGGHDEGPTHLSIRALQNTLDAFIVHRARIRKCIADIDAGRL